jgi:hypothetical protein
MVAAVVHKITLLGSSSSSNKNLAFKSIWLKSDLIELGASAFGFFHVLESFMGAGSSGSGEENIFVF